LIAYVFGYASLVALREPLQIDGAMHASVPGRLHGYRRCWGVAMDNWDAVNDRKHFLVPGGGERPRLRVAYLDIEPSQGATVNGLAVPVDPTRLAGLDAREVNYERFDVTAAFQPALSGTVYAYKGTAAARSRCQAGIAEENVCISGPYLAGVREAFAGLGAEALAEFDRSADPLPFPERDLERIWLDA
jgi:hypothetical protein